MTTLFINIKELVNVRTVNVLLRGKALKELPVINNAFLLIEDDVISMFGSMADLEWMVPNKPSNVIDISGKFILPSWCDSHTHIVFAGTRESEFVDKINGLSYSEIAAKGGGILNSSKKLNEASEGQLFDQAWKRLKELQKLGTGAIEIKSGYGLTLEGELKMLRVIKKLKEKSGMIIKSTFLGAHTFPTEFKENHDGYIDLIINEMLPAEFLVAF